MTATAGNGDGVLVEPAWSDARRAAHAAGRPLSPQRISLVAADRRILAEDVVAATALPPFRMSAMDGWAVAGTGPWRVVGRHLAGSVHAGTLAAGQAVAIATGAAVPEGTRAVLRTEHGRVSASGLVSGEVPDGRDMRLAGEEVPAGEVLIPAGTRLTPAHLGLAAAAGVDTLLVEHRPTAQVLIFGDELLDSGPARGGRVRDSLGPQLPGWLSRMGVDTTGVTRVPDTLVDHVAALRAASGVDLVVTTGGTAAGPVDFLHAALAETGGELIIDSVAVRPGHPMLLGRWGTHRWLVGLPGNPQSAVAALLSLGTPLIAALRGLGLPALSSATLVGDVNAPEAETRLVAATLVDREAVPTAHRGSGMLRGLAAADGFAVIPPGGAAAGSTVGWLPLPG